MEGEEEKGGEGEEEGVNTRVYLYRDEVGG